MSRHWMTVAMCGGLLVGACARSEPTSTPTTAVEITTMPETTMPDTTQPDTTVTVAPAVAAIGTTVEGSIVTADGRTRTYRLYTPSTVPEGPVPLLVALHGGTGWGAQFQRTSGFDGLAEANGFLVVFPDGIGIGADGTQMRTWNAGYCCGPAVRENVDDVAFIDALIDAIGAEHDIDDARVFAAGHSNGGMLSYRLACELSDRIVAVGVQSGSLGVEPCAPSRPVSLLHIHGSEDRNHPIEGGEGSVSISGVSYRSAMSSVELMAAGVGCGEASASAERGDLRVTTWSGCDGVEVQLLAVTGASHAWMGHPAPNPSADPPYQGIDSSVEILTFLLNHPRAN
ncbi:MAG: alpha/beta fold hydrolase [Actinomycetota bacterium]|nr:alpha/beta fold hydrolase [Actinomycetota bacterium]